MDPCHKTTCAKGVDKGGSQGAKKIGALGDIAMNGAKNNHGLAL